MYYLRFRRWRRSDGVRHGLAMLLCSAGLAPLWAVSIPRAKVADLASAWGRAPEYDLGLAIFH
eukprot:7257092-Pyramimonas_sp.AAC.1